MLCPPIPPDGAALGDTRAVILLPTFRDGEDSPIHHNSFYVRHPQAGRASGGSVAWQFRGQEKLFNCSISTEPGQSRVFTFTSTMSALPMPTTSNTPRLPA